ncbi:MAG: hypothetical protein IKV61_01890 [Clostridia bacterium]|nr:hypothetical protein [Clostridia bacterium]
METVNVKCPLCGHQFTTQKGLETATCPFCNKQFLTVQGIRYLKSLEKLKSEDKKVALGEMYQKVDGLIDKIEFYLDEEDYETAQTLIDEALTITTTDFRIYLNAVVLRTKNFTDLKDTTHLPYLKKAIDFATTMQKEQIRKLYEPYYKKCHIPEEEIEEYSAQEASSIKERVETILKDGIPKHFTREKHYKFTKIALPVSAIITAVLMILSLFLNNLVLDLACVGLFAITFVVLTIHLSVSTITKQFNAILDFYDNYSTFNLKEQAQVKVLKRLEYVAVSYINNEGYTSLGITIEKLIEECLKTDSEKLIEYVKNDKVFKSYVVEEE